MSTPSVSQASRLVRSAILVGVVATAVVGSADARAKPTPAQKCAAAKRRLVGKKIAALTACDAMAVARGVPIAPTCNAKASTRFRTAWAKAENAARGACATREDATTMEATLAAHDAPITAFRSSPVRRWRVGSSAAGPRSPGPARGAGPPAFADAFPHRALTET